MLIGALTGLAVVALIVLTERLGLRMYPVGSPVWPVTREGGLEGIVGRNALRQAIASGDGAKQLKELAGTAPFPHVHADHPLGLALERMHSSIFSPS